MRALWNLGRLYFRLHALNLRSTLEYEGDFYLVVLGMLLLHGSGLLFLDAVFQRVPAVLSWTREEALLTYAVFLVARGLADLAFDGIWMLGSLVHRADLDRLLLRPVPPLLQLLASKSSWHGLGSILLGAAVGTHALTRLGPLFDVSRWWWLPVIVVNGVAIIVSTNIVSNCVAFLDPSLRQTFPMLVADVGDFGKYPTDIFGRGARFILTYVVPFAFVSALPVAALLGRRSGLFALPVSGLLAVCLARLVWRAGLRRYESAGH